MQLSIRRDFAAAPGPRYRDEGKHSGQEFREDVLVPRLVAAIESGDKLIVDLDGSAGYATSFLEESFGGLIREHNFTFAELEGVLEFKSDEEPQLIGEIMDYMQNAKQKRANGGGER